MNLATVELTVFLEQHLPKCSDNWWKENVENKLSFSEQRILKEKRYTKLQQLDLAALLRLIDQNWFELSVLLNFPREARNWIKELQTIRNKWAHASSDPLPPSENYRDVDTLSRVLAAINASEEAQKVLDTEKKALLELMTNSKNELNEETQLNVAVKAHDGEESSQSKTKFKVGDLVVLKADPNVILP